jgi:LAGLIDADG endonuclease
MAIDHSIPPFPADIDRVTFGHWLSGFVDGEGCFLLGFHRHRKDRQFIRPTARFTIGLRDDDKAILGEIQAYWQCGTIHKGHQNQRLRQNPSAAFEVRKIDHLWRVVVAHFNQYPLRAKKQRDFAIWKLGIELIAERQYRPLTDAYLRNFKVISDCLREARKFNGMTRPMPSPEKYEYLQNIMFPD